MVFAKTTIRKEQPMCHYHHLTLVEREKNMFFHAQDNSVSAIAKSLGVTRRPFPENYGEIPKMDFINLPLPNIRSQILLSPTTSSLGTRIRVCQEFCVNHFSACHVIVFHEFRHTLIHQQLVANERPVWYPAP